ncbi:MAG: helix-turn-helix transcriptional regulator [Sulfurimonas sp.]|jgi:transcriptional regulator with XRE-family HTH domain
MIELMSPHEIASEFVQIIEKERIRQDLRQKDLFDAAGISSSAYAKFLKNKNTSFENIIKLLVALGMHANIQGLLFSQKFASIEEIREAKAKKRKLRVKKAKDAN